MEKKVNAQAFVRILKEHGINSLYHFTDRKNLESIIRHGGLYSWGDCIEQGIAIPCPGGDKQSRELDEKKGLEYYVRTSFTRNHPMMYQAKNEGRIDDPVILEIDTDVITWQDTRFSDKNSVRNDMHHGSNLEDFVKIHFDSTQFNTHFDLEDSEMPFYQAEVMVKNFIPLKYIKNIDKFHIYILDIDEHIEYVRHKVFADKGNPTAQLCLGLDYFFGKAGHQDYVKALDFFQKAANQGMAEAQYRLALCYDNGEGTSVDMQKAIFWYEKAADQGYEDAIFNLAATYSNGIEIEQNPSLAFMWYNKGAQLGFAECQRYLGLCYENGFGTGVNYQQAFHWYSKSANQDNVDAMYNIANCYNYGKVVPQNLEKAFEWYLKAAELGHPQAQDYVATFYKNGVYVDVDLEESARWCLLAAYSTPQYSTSG